MKYLFAFLCLIFLATPSMASINVTQADSTKAMKLTPKMERKIQKLKKKGPPDFGGILALLSLIAIILLIGIFTMIFGTFWTGLIIFGVGLIGAVVMFLLGQ